MGHGTLYFLIMGFITKGLSFITCSHSKSAYFLLMRQVWQASITNLNKYSSTPVFARVLYIQFFSGGYLFAAPHK